MASNGPSLDTGNLGANQRCTMLEVLRTICRPGLKLSLIPSKCFSMLEIRVGSMGLHQAARDSAA
jgi:hypothetical protein